MPIHPLVVHFPIALFITALGFEILSVFLKNKILHQTAWYNYVLGIFSAPVAVSTGLWDGRFWTDPHFYAHRTFGCTTLGFCIISGLILVLAKRKSLKLFRILFFFLLLAVVGFVAITAYYGGKLVY